MADRDPAKIGGQRSSVVMLLPHEKFEQFSHLPMADPTTHTLALYCFSVSSRDEVDTVSPPRAQRR